MTVDLAALRKLAEAATKGPWEANGVVKCGEEGQNCWHTFSEQADIVPPLGERGPVAIASGERDAAFIAAASPSTVLALLDALQDVTQDRDACAEERDVWERREKQGYEATAKSIAELRAVAEAALAYIQHYTTGTMGALWLALSSAGYVPTPSNMP